MTPYRQETLGPENQPVRFYKIIALTFLALTIVLLGVIVFTSTKRAVITITAKSDPMNVNFSLGVNEKDQLVSIQGIIVTTTVSVTKDFKPTQTRQITSAPGSTKVVLHNDSSADQALIPTTRLLTASGVLFRIKNRVNVPAGGTIETEVYADDKLATSPVPVGKMTVPGLNEEKQKVIYATALSSYGGTTRTVGVVGAEDVKNAELSIQSEIEKQAKNNLTTKYSEMAVVVKIITSSVTSTVKVGDEVEQFSMKGTGSLVLVFYKQDEVNKLAKKELEKQIVSDTELLTTKESSADVTLNEYDLTLGTAKLNVAYSGLVSLNTESKQLEKSAFLGKSEQEVRRYLLSLDHVKSVEVSFSPAWTRTVPSLPEHVSVVVKSVE